MLNLRSHFPALKQMSNGQPLVYLDSAATALKPAPVVEAMRQFDYSDASNVHRGAHELSEKATVRFENARAAIAKFIGASSTSEIVFTRGTTEGLNLLAMGLSRSFVQPGDSVLLSVLEHHSNIVPWHLAGLKTVAFGLTSNGDFDLEDYKKKLDKRPKIVALSQGSNVLGTITPIREMTKLAHAVGAIVVVDAAQSVTCMPLNVEELDCDFLCFSGHKLFGPFGIGVLYGKLDRLKALPPYQGGGSMIETVTLDRITYLEPPQRFEAGTPNITGVIGLHAAINFVDEIGWNSLWEHEQTLLKHAREELETIPGLKLYAKPQKSAAILSFQLGEHHPSDVGHILNQQGVAVRTGHHCAQPLMAWLKTKGTVRASFSIYNTEDDIHRLKAALLKAKELLS